MIVIDIHAHFLPSIDDGPMSIEESINMLVAYINDGVTHVVATPHVYLKNFKNNRSSNEEALVNFYKKIEYLSLPITLQVAGEVRFDENIPKLYALGELPFLGKSDGLKCLLVEFPDAYIPFGAKNLIGWMIDHEIQPVIAHPERNRTIRENPTLIHDFVNIGCKLQITANSLAGGFGEQIKKTAWYMVKSSLVTAVASDAHNTLHRRPCMSLARDLIVQECSEAEAEFLTVTGPASLCLNHPNNVVNLQTSTI